MTKQTHRKWLITLTLGVALLVCACGGGGDAKPKRPTPPLPTASAAERGSVGLTGTLPQAAGTPRATPTPRPDGGSDSSSAPSAPRVVPTRAIRPVKTKPVVDDVASSAAADSADEPQPQKAPASTRTPVPTRTPAPTSTPKPQSSSETTQPTPV